MSTPRDKDESFAALFEKSNDARAGRRRHHVGETLEVTIVAIHRDSVFADLGGKQEGYFERSDFVDESGKLRVEVGSRVTATVRAVDNNGQAALSPVVVRDAQGETTALPTQQATQPGGPVLVEGARVRGKITGIERYGVFVQANGTRDRAGRGLVPTAETGTPRGADLKKHFTVGQEVEVKILNVAEDGKVRMSIGALAADEDRAAFDAYRSNQDEPAAAASPEGGEKKAAKGGGKPAPRNFGTLGDLLSKKQKR